MNDCLRLLTFRAENSLFGVEMSQIAEMIDLAEAERRRMPLVWFHGFLNSCKLQKSPESQFKNMYLDNNAYHAAPAVLVLRDAPDGPAISIDQPQDANAIDCAMPLEAVHPLPPLLRTACPGSPIWGAAIDEDGRIVLLVDFYQLIAICEV